MYNRKPGHWNFIALVAACVSMAAAFGFAQRPSERTARAAAASRSVDSRDAAIAARDACSPAWLPTFGQTPGTNGQVRAFTTFDDGSGYGPALYVGGTFTTAGGVTVNHVARWDGSRWSALGSGTNGDVEALASFDDGLGAGPALYAGGTFTSAGGVAASHVAKWNGTSWSALGGGVPGAVHALLGVSAESGGPVGLYAGGDFTTAPGQLAPNILRWDGTNWSPLGSGTDGPVYALTLFDDGGPQGPSVCVGGQFGSAGGQLAIGVARWNGSSWSSFSLGLLGAVHALAVFDDGSGPALYGGGNFQYAGSTLVNRIARWNGAEWNPVGSGFEGFTATISALVGFDDGSGPRLIAGGFFTQFDGSGSQYLAQWDGAAWSELAPGGDVSTAAEALAVFDDGRGGGLGVYVGGSFVTAGDLTVRGVARWTRTGWSVLGTGLDGTVYALTMFDDQQGDGPALYAGGAFTHAGGTFVNHIARWDGAKWQAVGDGVDSTVLTLRAVDDGSALGPALYVGGFFNSAGDVTAHRIAKWDGSTWSGLGSGLSAAGGEVLAYAQALLVHDDGSGPALFVGGRFGFAGGVSAPGVARWNGTSWSSPGGGVGTGSSMVYALASFRPGPTKNPILVAGGGFSVAGGAPAKNIARWDGSSWLPFGSGASASVMALQSFDDGSGPTLVAGGYFTLIDGVAVNYIARWDGNSWLPLGAGVSSINDGDAPVRTLLVSEDWEGNGQALYAGGQFTIAGDDSAKHVARWDGSAWTPLGDGVDGYVRALAVHSDDATGAVSVFAGGPFATSTVGDSYLVHWQGCPLGCVGDLDGSGTVDAADIAQLLGQWGGAGSADLDGDGSVGAADLAIVLGAWGEC